jgi:hypothetical protein
MDAFLAGIEDLGRTTLVRADRLEYVGIEAHLLIESS